jgi:SAM-dependent methyltransferase
LVKDDKYLQIVAHYEACLERFGDTHRGVDWPNLPDAERRYDVMLGVIPPEAAGPVTVLDFGCGAAHLYEHIQKRGLGGRVAYSGLDLSPKFVGLCRQKHPEVPFFCLDILENDGAELPEFDYVVMNGVFTEKCSLTEDEMMAHFEAVVTRVFEKARRGIAFNVMSKQVDWERTDLFHLSFDTLAAFLTKRISRHFVLRHDYRLFEYTAYVYR